MNELVISTYIQILQEVMIDHDKQEAAGSFLLESISTQESANVVTDLSSKKISRLVHRQDPVPDDIKRAALKKTIQNGVAKYFEKETVLKEIFSIYEREFPTASGAFDEFVTKTVPNILACIHSADVAPVVHGKWVKDENSCHYDYYLTYFDFNCSICGEIENDQHGLPNYCPNCGAKMEV